MLILYKLILVFYNFIHLIIVIIGSTIKILNLEDDEDNLYITLTQSDSNIFLNIVIFIDSLSSILII